MSVRPVLGVCGWIFICDDFVGVANFGLLVFVVLRLLFRVLLLFECGCCERGETVGEGRGI